jgi:hypothetical protein
VKAEPARAVPRYRVWSWPAIVLTHANASSIRFARPLAREIARMAYGPAIDPRASACEVLCEVRRRVQGPPAGDEARRIVGAIGPDRDPVPSRHGRDQRRGRVAFSVAGGRGQLGADHQAGTVLHQEMAHEAELGLLAAALAEQLGRRVGGRGVGLVAPALAVEVAAAVAAGVVRRAARVVLGPEALDRTPC